MLAEERRQFILGLIREQGSARTVELAKLLQVSDQTIRRDLEDLQGKGLVSKHHGGGVLLNGQTLSHSERSELRHAEKRAIASRAAAIVRSGMVIGLGPGTTTELVAAELDGREIEIVTNSLAVARSITSPLTSVRITGGTYRASSELMVGEWSTQNLTDLFLDVAFIGVSGIGGEGGYTVTEKDEALVLRQLVRVARQAVIVADSSKFHRAGPHTVAPLMAVHALITDADIPRSDRQRLEEKGVAVWIAEGN